MVRPRTFLCAMLPIVTKNSIHYNFIRFLIPFLINGWYFCVVPPKGEEPEMGRFYLLDANMISDKHGLPILFSGRNVDELYCLVEILLDNTLDLVQGYTEKLPPGIDHIKLL